MALQLSDGLEDHRTIELPPTPILHFQRYKDDKITAP